MIFLDLDGTICESNQKITPEMKVTLRKLDDFVVVSGATKAKMEEQLDGLLCPLMAQSGNETELWTNTLTPAEVKEVSAHIKKIDEWLEPHRTDIKVDMIQNRGCQISLSITGHDAPIEIKKKCDPNKNFRQWLLVAYPFVSETLKCSIGGNTCLDYTHKDGDKGHNIARYIKEKGLDPKECVYYGDGLFPGGNDESVMGVIKTIEVSNPQDLLAKLLDIG